MSETFLMHEGRGHLDGGKSGRYPWGSGENPYQHNSFFYDRYNELKKEGFKDTEIVKILGPEWEEKTGQRLRSTDDLRSIKSVERDALYAANSSTAWKLHEKGYSNVKIGEMMGGIPESTIRNYLKSHEEVKQSVLKTTANMLKDNVDEKEFIDVGKGVEQQLGISREKLKAAVKSLKAEGYNVHYVNVYQINNPENKTTITVLAKPCDDWSEQDKYIKANREKIRLIKEYSEDGGLSYLNIIDPVSVNSKRISVRYAEDGGEDRDGLIELRRGVDDISLGQANYAQVRIAVDGTHYLKGMAVYSDDLPKGVDIRFNTNKHKGTPMLGDKDNSVLKGLKDDPENPFGTTIKQRYFTDKNGNKQLSPINIVYEEGDWEKWGKHFSSQFLSKQKNDFAKKQLDVTYKDRLSELEEIESYTNPSVRKRLLYSFADDCDSASCDLKACALPRTSNYVLLPFPEIKENEIYAPNFKDGERVALVRHPHGGTFEIPELTVNRKYSNAKKIIGDSPDAVGINPKVAQKLSGADFDGDTVLVIPNNRGQIKSSPSLKGLENFDPKVAYPGYDGMKRMNERTKGIEMGKISNLITDMTLQDAPQDEIVRAVKHSMVVIDAEKHNLNYQQSFKDNGIAALKKKYQGSEKAGASTLISRASAEIRVPKRRETRKINPKTGEKIYEELEPSYYTNKKGKQVLRETKIPTMKKVSDAYSLSTGTVMENTYADYANRMKSLALKARKEAYSTKEKSYSPSAAKTYSKEVASLNSKLNTAEKNAPYERKATVLARQALNAARQSNPDMSADDAKKAGARFLASARVKVGAKKTVIGSKNMPLTEKEWEAIQAGAISPTKLDRILINSDLDTIKQYATPRSKPAMTSSKIAKAKAMIANGCTQADVADALGVSVTTLRNNL